MKQLLIIVLALYALNLSAQSNSSKEMDRFIDDLMGKMTLIEKLGQLNLSSGAAGIPVIGTGDAREDYIKQGLIGSSNGIKSQKIAVNQSRLGIPLISGRDIIHGHSTIFPIPLASSCSWDLERIEGSARIAAEESTVTGTNWNYSPMVDICRDPRWGRIAEGAGEDSWYGAKVAAAMIKGYQGDDLSKPNTMMACVKHFALYGASEAGRDYNTVDMSRQVMFQDYLAPYKAAVDAGVGSVMTSFNLVDGVPATGNRWLMTELLREQWGFDGFVVTDYTAINEMMEHGVGDLETVVVKALKAGVDMDMVGQGFIGKLTSLLDQKKVTIEEIDLACRRILEAKYKLGLFEDPFRYFNEEKAKEIILSKKHLQSARELAQRSIVLLKNSDNILPLKKEGTIGVVGPLSDTKVDLLGMWCAYQEDKHLSTIAEAIADATKGEAKVLQAKGTPFTTDLFLANRNREKKDHVSYSDKELKEMLDKAKEVAAKSDIIIAVLGEPRDWTGEAASRADITIPECQQDLLREMLSFNKPVVLVLANGRPLALKWENDNLSTIVEAWHGGTEAANAVADVLFGDYNPSAKLTVSFPVSVGQIPVYYNQKKTGRPYIDNYKFTSKYLDIPNEPLFPFGYGLSYTTFDYSDIKLNKQQLTGDSDRLTATVTVTNSGKIKGEEIVQLYINDPIASVSRAMKELKGFEKISLEAGESKEVTFKITTEELKFFDQELKYDWEDGEFNIMIGTNSRDLKSISISWKK